ncbi:NAD(P)/FAD-dependent oxidoreductase [Dehalobacter sp. DCM]|uniref:phytoene desaturase family protein n=1 Tax=Dehalobacter sp. DCM TaxID=2907827 RepID=UPI00308219F3|nr:NAD(P)/FAD-dependent oxidoreductase [Dehalobacter sp. DCM]
MGDNNQFDVIVIGAGQNGLTAAAYMAKAGLDVAVLEDKGWIGGSAITKEITLPGFKHDLASTGFAFALNNPAVVNDELGLFSKYGLELCYPKFNVVNLYDDGTALPIFEDLDEMCQAIAAYSEEDAEAYRKFTLYLQSMLPLLATGMFNAPPKMGMLFNQLDMTPLGQEFMRILFMSAWDLSRQWFKHPKTINMMLNYASEAMVDVEQSGSALYVVAMVAPAHVHGRHMAYLRGGMQSLPDSLARCIEANGGKVLVDHEVVKINTRGGKVVGVTTANGQEFTARKAVISNVDPRLTLNKWLDNPLEANLRQKIDNIAEPAFSGMGIHLALDVDPTFKAPEYQEASKNAVMAVTLTSSLEEFRQYFIDMRTGKVPKPAKLMNLLQHRCDPTRCPDGKAALYIWQFLPYFINEGPDQWDNIKEQVSNEAIEKFFSYTSNLSEKNILKKVSISPLDFERTNQNRIHGSILGPSPALYQYMSYRPIPELGQYRTPVEGLYLSGQSCHPGGGVTLGGRATAQIVMQDLGIDFEDVI